jgi:peptidoglycan/xylan/chitin deacetylase (PgdA/CDA1 family)
MSMTRRIPIVAYHSILQDECARLPEAWTAVDTVARSSFCAQLDRLQTDGWHTLSAAALNHAGARNFRQRQILLTFDDGHESDLLAATALAARGFTATFFIPWVNIGRPHYLDRRSVKQLSRDGFRIGSHGLTHCRLDSVGAERLRQELTESKARLEDLVGLPVIDLAVPFGSYDQRVIEAALRAGYAAIMTSDIKRAVLGSRNRVFPRLPVKSFTTCSDFLALIRGSAFAVWRWRLAMSLYGRIMRECVG